MAHTDALNARLSKPLGQRRDWRDMLAARLAISDTLVFLWVVVGAQIAWLGLNHEAVDSSGARGVSRSSAVERALSCSREAPWALAKQFSREQFVANVQKFVGSSDAEAV